MEVGAALGKLVDVLDGDTVCVEVGAVMGKLVHALDGHTVCVEVGAALGKLVAGLDGVTVCVVVGVALGKLVDVLDGDTVCLHTTDTEEIETKEALLTPDREKFIAAIRLEVDSLLNVTKTLIPIQRDATGNPTTNL